MSSIDSTGAYKGTIEEATLDTTKKGFPQFVARLKATEKFIEDKADLEHFVKEGAIEEATPQWVDWSGYDETITAFLVLFRSDEVFDDETKLLNYEQLQLALDWDGTEFASLADKKTHIGKTILFRVDENEYEGKTRLQVDWVDSKDASPNRELRDIDDEKLKGLQSKLKIGGKAKPAKPAGKPSKPAPAKSAPAEEKPAEKAEEKAEEKPAEKAPAAPPKAPAKGKVADDRPTESTKEKSWEFVCARKGNTDMDDVTEAWITACNAVGEDKDEDDFTGEDWAKVRDLVIEDLALDA